MSDDPDTVIDGVDFKTKKRQRKKKEDTQSEAVPAQKEEPKEPEYSMLALDHEQRQTFAAAITPWITEDHIAAIATVRIDENGDLDGFFVSTDDMASMALAKALNTYSDAIVNGKADD